MPSESASPTVPADSTPAEVDLRVRRAEAAGLAFRRTTGAARAASLRGIAAAIDDAVPRLVEIGRAETGLGEARLDGEVRRTATGLRMLADWIDTGRHEQAIVEDADPGHPLGAHPRMVKRLIPVGVVLNFAAGNFPFAFSVAGVDTAAALAAGCPVVVKAHPGHPRTSAATFDVMRAGLAAAGGDPEVVQIVYGAEAGVLALRHPAVRAASFTGSVAGGTALAAIAAARPRPIPFYGELGSINPVLITPGALDERRSDLAREFVDVVADSAGQVCTKPGVLLVPTGDPIVAAIGAAAAEVLPQRMLSPRMGEAYAAARDRLLAFDAVRVVAGGEVDRRADDQVWATPTIVTVPFADALRAADVVAEEVFGPTAVVVEYDDLADVVHRLGDLVTGSLTASIHLAAAEVGMLPDAVAELEQIAGRVVVNGWPDAVYLLPTQHHGGPAPATTLDVPAATSVGPGSIARFQRAVVVQNADGAFAAAATPEIGG